MGLLDHKRKMYIPTGIYDEIYPKSDEEKRRLYKVIMKHRRKQHLLVWWGRLKRLLVVLAAIIATIAGLLDIIDHLTAFH